LLGKAKVTQLDAVGPHQLLLKEGVVQLQVSAAAAAAAAEEEE
jgi:hypothetical protein